MKIAVLSDSHFKTDYTKEVLDLLLSKGAQYIIHAGDLQVEANLKHLKNTGLPYVSVFGNNDFSLSHLSDEYKIEKEPYLFKIKDTKFKLMHLPYYMNGGDADVVVFGHTHAYESEYVNKTLFLNPGEVCARNKPLIESVLLEINDNEYIINYYTRKTDEEEFRKEEIRYERN